MKFLLALTLALAAGCGGSAPPTRFYHLGTPPAGHGGGNAVLVLEQLTTDAGYDDERMVYRVNPYRFDYYDYHRWSAAPGVMVGNYLEQALERSGKFRSVIREATPDAALVMTGRVAAIEEIDKARQWFGHIVLELQLTDQATGQIVWTDQFDETVAMPKQSPEGLARALSTAMARVVAKVAPQLGELAERHDAARRAQADARP
jgi:ABC-type uncharacterized transport system auxiliary subunit